MTKIVFEALDEDGLGIFDIVSPKDWIVLDYEIATLDRYRFDWSKIAVRDSYSKSILNKQQVIDLDEDDDECI